MPRTLAGTIIQKMVTQKSFLPAVGELIQATEQTKGLVDEAEEIEDKTNEKNSEKQLKTKKE